jgi:MFS family permease
MNRNEKETMKFDLWLLGICSARVFTYLVFLAYAAALPVLHREWEMSATAAGSISSGLQIGFAVSLVVFSELADRIGARRVYLWSHFSVAIVALLFAIFSRGYYSGLILYTLIGISLGGTYPPALMMIADRYPTKGRGTRDHWLVSSWRG